MIYVAWKYICKLKKSAIVKCHLLCKATQIENAVHFADKDYTNINNSKTLKSCIIQARSWWAWDWSWVPRPVTRPYSFCLARSLSKAHEEVQQPPNALYFFLNGTFAYRVNKVQKLHIYGKILLATAYKRFQWRSRIVLEPIVLGLHLFRDVVQTNYINIHNS